MFGIPEHALRKISRKGYGFEKQNVYFYGK